MKNSEQTNDLINITEMQQFSARFVKERNWEKFHSPKNLAIGIAIESGELNEQFIWLTDQQSFDIKNDKEKMEKVRDELGDILHYIIRLSDLLEISLKDAFWNKIHKTIKKYPVDQVKGSSETYEKLH